ncbi:MAG: PAS domain S-box protein [Dehalococcoidia bacterium]|jgi:PAS domain S-box-containing protein
MRDKRIWRILNVDDNEAGRYVTTKILKNAGFDVIEAANGSDALTLAANQHPDLVLLDVNLPDINGFLVCKQIKLNPDTASILVVHQSAVYVSPKDRVEGLTGGADGYLVHPLDPGELVETIRAFLRIREMEGALRESEELFRGLFDTVTSGVAIYEVHGDGATGKDYIIRDFNKMALEIEGKTKDEVIGKSLSALRPKVDEYGIIPVFQRVWKTGVPELFPQKIYVDEKYSSWYENRIFRLQSGEVVAVYNDVTERKRAEEALHESGQRINFSLEAADMGAWELDLVKHTAWRSLRHDQIFGYEELLPEWTYEMFLNHVLPEDRSIVDTKFGQALEKFSDWEFECRIRRKDGAICWIWAKGRPEYNDLHEPKKMFGLVQDITKRKRAEEALWESEEKYRMLFSNMLDGFAYCRMIYDSEGHPDDFIYLNVNQAFDRIIGTKTVTMKRVTEVFPGIRDSYPKLFEIYGRVAWTGTPESFEINFKPIEKWLHISVYSPAKEFFVAVFEDITTRKQVEAALHESEEKFRAIFHSANDAIQIHEIGPDFTPGKFIDVNDGACRMLMMSREEILVHSPLDFAVEYHNPPLPEIIQLFTTKGGAIFETGHRRSDGVIVPVEINAHIINLQGKTVMLGIIRDITERKRAEDALRQANKQLNLLSSITRHDILNQLMALKGYLYLSKEMIDDPTILTGYIQKEEQAANTIEHQITFTKVYQELGVAAPEWQSVNASVQKAMAGLPMRDVRIEVDPKNPAIFADPLFEKVFYNLIDNALKYGGEGMKTIRVSSQETDTGLLIVCEDDGVGISGEDKKKLFTRGFGKNTGLGLFLSREILAITGITITENGVPGKGARFEIAVPKGTYRFTGTGEK